MVRTVIDIILRTVIDIIILIVFYIRKVHGTDRMTQRLLISKIVMKQEQHGLKYFNGQLKLIHLWK